MAGGLGTIFFEVYSDLKVLLRYPRGRRMGAVLPYSEFGKWAGSGLFSQEFLRWPDEHRLSKVLTSKFGEIDRMGG